MIIKMHDVARGMFAGCREMLYFYKYIYVCVCDFKLKSICVSDQC